MAASDSESHTAGGFEALLERARRLRPLPVAVVAAAEGKALLGAMMARQAGLMEPVLIGEAEAVRAEWSGLDDGPVPEIVEPKGGESAAAVGVRLVAESRVDALMKGALHTEDLMRPVLEKLRGGRGA